jgi:hypothetical protein
MANRAKGEISVTVDGAKKVLVLDWEAMCQFEDLLDVSFNDFLARLSEDKTGRRTKMMDLRAIIWAAMLYHQPDATLPQASAVCQALGADIGDTIRDLLIAGGLIPDPDEAAAGNARAPETAPG